MSFHFHPGAYEQIRLEHAELMTRAEIERQLRDAAPRRPSLAARARYTCGRLLIALGERLARPVTAIARS
jgi:hypothetical protein